MLDINSKRTKTIKKNSILFKLWRYFIGFAAMIFIMLWLFQIVFLNYFYESMKINEITRIGTTIQNEFDSEDFAEVLTTYALTKSLKITVVDEYGHYRMTNDTVLEYMPPMSKLRFDAEYGRLEDEGLKYIIKTSKIPKLDNSLIEFNGYLGNIAGIKYYITISSVLEPVDSAIDILKEQLFLVSIISLVLAMIMSFFISKRLSEPIVQMSKTAIAIGKGNYDIMFKKGDYQEIDDLSDTLNYATGELKKTLQLRKDLLANVSHDLKTPLTVIKSYGEMIRDISGDNKEKRNEHIEVIIEEADHLTKLVNDLLDVSKLESSVANYEITTFDLGDIVDALVVRFTNYRSDFDFEIIKTGNLKIEADYKRIEQVVYNLISNAINYSGESKKLILKTEETEEGVRFDCIDFGIGIKEEDIEGIWDRFYRGSGNRTRSKVGTGLGLFIVKSILEGHGFEYGVTSKENEGSNFYFIAKKEEKKNKK